MEPLITIIIPVYNAEENLSNSLDSLNKLNYKNLQIIFVNDASTDNSLRILEIFATSTRLVCQFLSHDKNLGVAAARNTGLNNADGDYIYFLDADDSLHPDALNIMVGKAMEKDYDIVGCNWSLSFEKNSRKMNQYNFQEPWHAVEAILEGKMRWNLWLFLIKRSLFEKNNIQFIPNLDMGEDLVVMCKLFTFAEKVTYVNKHLYYYFQLNNQSLTKVYNDNHIKQVTENIAELEFFLYSSKFSALIQNRINILKLILKLPLLISDKKENYNKWLSWFQESNKFIFDKSHFNLRTRFLHWSAYNKQYWLIKFYYNFLVRFVYGVIYR